MDPTVPAGGTDRPEQPEGAAEVDVRAELLAAEASLGTDPRTRSASACMRALARASRAYLIYEPSNEIIKTFLAEVQRCFGSHLSQFAELDLGVRPFEFSLDGEVVYRERDWERSLAFKLFRDGVRRLTVRARVTWEELTQFLAILSIRYVGVSLDEDDVLTLLWKASFKHISFEAVEGFVPTDDEDVPDQAAGGGAVRGVADGFFPRGGGSARAPADFDLPPPELPRVQRAVPGPVPEERLAALRQEYGSPQLPRDLVQLVDALVEALEDPGDPLQPSEAAPFLTEVRDFLLSEEEVDLLLLVANRIARGRMEFGRESHGSDDREGLDALVDGFTSVEALRRILATVPDSATTPPAAYAGLLALHRGDPLQTLFEVLDLERSASARRFTQHLIAGHLPHRVADVIQRFESSSPPVAADLLRVLTSGAEPWTRTLLNDVIHHGAPEVKLEFLAQVGAAASGDQRAFLVLLLSAPEPEVRIRALEVVGGLGEKGGWLPVQRQLTARLAAGATDEEFDALGRALAKLDPDRAVAELLPVAGKRRLFHSLRQREVRARRVAVAALCTLAARGDVRPVLEEVAQGSDECGELARSALGEAPGGSGPDASGRPAAGAGAAPRAQAAGGRRRVPPAPTSGGRAPARRPRPRPQPPVVPPPEERPPWDDDEGGGDA